ncbi:MAG: 6-bladed beta-propeller [Parabacteroides sp.]|nr:6-bladed beta-propeller [Parabacteroides sp.]
MKIIFYSLIVIILFSCQKEIGVYECNLSLRKEAKISELVGEYTLIPLETTDENLIVDATVVKLSESKIFILDKFSPTRSLYVFQRDGKYIGKIGCVGEGPGEYIMPFYFVIDEKNDKLYLWDRAVNKILIYNISTFKFVNEFFIPFNASCFEKLGDKHFVFYIESGLKNEGNFQKHLQIVDLQGNPVESQFERLDFPLRGLYNVTSYFFENEGDTYFHHPFMGEYYKCALQDTVLSPLFCLNVENLKFPSKSYIINNKESIIENMKQDNYIQWCDFLKNSKNYLFYWGIGDDIYWGKYNEKEKKGWYVNKNHLIDDLGIIKLGRPKTVSKNYFVSCIYMENITKENITESSILKPYIDRIGGNPILFLYTSFSENLQ